MTFPSATLLAQSALSGVFIGSLYGLLGLGLGLTWGLLHIINLAHFAFAFLAAYLKKNRIDTIQGKLRFDGPSNYGDDLMRVKQVQNGRWVTVYPKEYAAPGATLAVQ